MKSQGVSFNADSTLSHHWVGAASQWICTMEEIFKNFHGIDSAWEYYEQSNSGIFSGSLTAAGMPSIPEAPAMREGSSSKSKRVDICSITREQDKSVWTLTEFKRSEPTGSNPKNVAADIRKKMVHAINDVNSLVGLHDRNFSDLDDTTEVKRVSAVYGQPVFMVNDGADSHMTSMENLINLLKDLPYDLKAWYFPPVHSITETFREPGTGKCYFGTFLCIHPVAVESV